MKKISVILAAFGLAGESFGHNEFIRTSDKPNFRLFNTMSNEPNFGGGGGIAGNMVSGAGRSVSQTNAGSSSTQMLANAILQLSQNNTGIINFKKNTKTLATPDATTFTATSTFNTTGTGAKTQTITIFNQGINGLGSSATNNGAGANSIAYNYNDTSAGTTNGAAISYVNGQMNKGDGNWCYGFNIQYQLNVGGTISSTTGPLLNSNLQAVYNNADSTQKFLYFQIQQAVRNTQFVGGLLTVVAGFNIPGFAQVSANLPAGDGATVGSSMTLTMVFMYRAIPGISY